MIGLDGKVVVVIGGLGLIGRGVVEGIAAAGAEVVVASRGAGQANALASFDHLPGEIRTRLHALPVDVCDPNSLDALLSAVEARWSRLDGLVNCAYPQQDAFGTRFEDVEYQTFRDNVSRHLGAFFLVAQKTLALFSNQGGGNLVQFSSVYGCMNPRFEIYEGTAMTKEIEYSVAKAGLIHMTSYLAKYHRGRGIRVNCISPGGVFNNQDPAFLSRYNACCNSKGMMAPADLAGATVFLLSDASAMINGQNVVVDDGFSL
jgi:NAD(P)-dependent dehydrogenase (short-subunit alcohol dehydrogenase family)